MDYLLTSSIDLAEILFTLFWIFFAFLVLYLHRESKREGYPLQADRFGRPASIEGFPGVPKPKTYHLRDGSTVSLPRAEAAESVAAVATAGFPGAPLAPTGNPMTDGVGPAAWCDRADHPDMTMRGLPQIAPLRIADDYHVESRDVDPRGMNVVAADNFVVGKIRDLWVDRIEPQIRYMEISLDDRIGGGNVLLPYYFCRINAGRGEVKVSSLMSDQFSAVPRTKHPDQVTLLEEDKICAYYAGGKLYAEPSRTEPIL